MTAEATAPQRLRFDRLGLLLAALLAGGLLLPLLSARANRIVPGEGRSITEALPGGAGWLLIALIAGIGLVALLRTPVALRLGAGLAGLAAVLLAAGQGARMLTPDGDTLARIAPAAGFWLQLFALGILVADALVQLKLRPLLRMMVLALVLAALGLMLWSGALAQLSVLREYASRADAFWREGRTHMLLAFGSLAAAVVVGVPVGIACVRLPALRASVLNLLNIVQTIPSIALFGLLIPLLAWVAATLPGAAAIGIAGIGVAPALLALFGYSLLPIVANTVTGILGVPAAVNEAARGVGMTDNQRLWQVELPLAFPVLLTGIRIVLVQNIGLATVAALIGGGGFGVFVFQGIGQTAMDLVLLGAVPTIVIAFSAAIVLDACVEMAGRRPAGVER